MAGLLTYSRMFCLPNPHLFKMLKSGFDLNTVIELTAAGQLRNHTVFPFNPGQHKPGTKSDANILNSPSTNNIHI